jgi:hypothetical protein
LIHGVSCKVMSLLPLIAYAVPFGADRIRDKAVAIFQHNVTELCCSCVAIPLEVLKCILKAVLLERAYFLTIISYHMVMVGSFIRTINFLISVFGGDHETFCIFYYLACLS